MRTVARPRRVLIIVVVAMALGGAAAVVALLLSQRGSPVPHAAAGLHVPPGYTGRVHVALGRGPRLYVDESSRGGHCSDSRSISEITPTAPLCSIGKAAEEAPSGSVVFVRAGTYPYQALHSLGSRGDYVTFEPYGYGTPSAESVTIAGLSTANTSFLRFQGFHFVGSDTNGYHAAIQIYIGSQNIQFINNDITGQGVQLQSASNVLLQGNHVHNITRTCSVTEPDGFGLHLNGGSPPNVSSNIQVIGNTIDDYAQTALQANNVSNILIQGNSISTTQNPSGATQCGDHVDLLFMDNHGQGPATVIDNNFHDGIQFILRNITGLTFARNLVLDVGGWVQVMADPGARFLNNTWYGGNGCPDAVHHCTAGSLIIRDYVSGSSWTRAPFNYTNHMNGTVIENNVMRILQNDKTDPAPLGDYAEDYNVLYGPQQNNSGLKGRHDLFTSPRFMDPASGNLAPAPSSPLVDSGDSSPFSTSPADCPDYLGQAPWRGPRGASRGAGRDPFVDRGAIELSPRTGSQFKFASSPSSCVG